MIKTVKIGSTTIPIENIDYINEGDGTAYSTPYIMLKTGNRILAGEHRSELRDAIKVIESAQSQERENDRSI